MSRNNLFFLLACALVAAIISGNPAPSSRSSPLTLASLISPMHHDMASVDPAIFQQNFDRQ